MDLALKRAQKSFEKELGMLKHRRPKRSTSGKELNRRGALTRNLNKFLGKEV